MFHSAIEILSSYITIKSPYEFYSVEMVRWDVVDTFYLCEVGDQWYIVYETDFIDNLSRVAERAKEIFGKNFEISPWLTKKQSLDVTPESLPIEESRPPSGALILKQDKTPLMYAVMIAKSKTSQSPHSSPTTYGGTSA